MKKLFLVLILVMAGFLGFAKDPCEGYWISYDENTSEITAGWKFYINENGQMEGVIVYSPDCDETTKAAGCKNLKPVSDFPLEGEFSKMKVLYETPWIFNLSFAKEGVWENGFIIDCGEGKKYNCKIIFQAADGKKYSEDTLIMRGSLGPVSRNQYWKRPDAKTIEILQVKARAITDFIKMIEEE